MLVKIRENLDKSDVEFLHTVSAANEFTEKVQKLKNIRYSFITMGIFNLIVFMFSAFLYLFTNHPLDVGILLFAVVTMICFAQHAYIDLQIKMFLLFEKKQSE